MALLTVAPSVLVWLFASGFDRCFPLPVATVLDRFPAHHHYRYDCRITFIGSRMNKYEAVVRVGLRIVKTLVFSSTAHDAKLLLERQYGHGNVVGFLQQLH